MVDLLDFNKIKENDFFILNSVKDKPKRIGEIAKEHKTLMVSNAYIPLKRLVTWGMVKSERLDGGRVITITKKGLENVTYAEMLKEVVW